MSKYKKPLFYRFLNNLKDYIDEYLKEQDGILPNENTISYLKRESLKIDKEPIDLFDIEDKDVSRLNILCDWIGNNQKQMSFKMGNIRLYILKIYPLEENLNFPSLTSYIGAKMVIQSADVNGQVEIINYTLEDFSLLLSKNVIVDINGLYDREMKQLFI